jgi:hypothetical protein
MHLLSRLRRRRGHAAPVVIDAALRVDADAVCPDCLGWIGPAEPVRRNAYGLVEHDVCPPLSVRQRHS